ncbi:hypothetical protein H3T59_04485 [Commensalibacter sp. M0357]|uniref:hypothetical protein n=1 Tax=unclassified Commensalibacter TaxID=2630218 RepID=UPI0018DD2BC6|nr:MULTISPECIES: hypothetical protein [unclassified Commensalibacter]MBI0074881.1 hypothetical protein [Commensalibacter sp. M0357]MBI0084722.1 hypothetical protein [Commensalibacter sp. M0355]
MNLPIKLVGKLTVNGLLSSPIPTLVPFRIRNRKYLSFHTFWKCQKGSDHKAGCQDPHKSQYEKLTIVLNYVFKQQFQALYNHRILHQLSINRSTHFGTSTNYISVRLAKMSSDNTFSPRFSNLSLKIVVTKNCKSQQSLKLH